MYLRRRLLTEDTFIGDEEDDLGDCFRSGTSTGAAILENKDHLEMRVMSA